MNPHQVLLISIYVQYFPPQITIIWYFTSVNPHVSCQYNFMCHFVSTHITLILYFPSVKPPMFCQYTCLCKKIVINALLLYIYGISSVCALMHSVNIHSCVEHFHTTQLYGISHVNLHVFCHYNFICKLSPHTSHL